MIATIWEVYNDRRGDLNKGRDVIIRSILISIEALILHYTFNKPVITSFMFSTAIFWLTFDYAISYVLIKNGTVEPPRGVTYNWFTYTAKKGVVDNIGFWRKMNPYLKLLIRVGYFGIALTLIFFIK